MFITQKSSLELLVLHVYIVATARLMWSNILLIHLFCIILSIRLSLTVEFCFR